MKGRLAIGLLIGACALALACGGGSEGGAERGAAASPEVIAQGRQLYDATCASCHGPRGKGDGPVSATLNPKPRDFGDKAYMEKLTDADIAGTIKMGGAAKNMPQMPSHPQFKDEELQALVAYVRTMHR